MKVSLLLLDTRDFCTFTSTTSSSFSLIFTGPVAGLEAIGVEVEAWVGVAGGLEVVCDRPGLFTL